MVAKNSKVEGETTQDSSTAKIVRFTNDLVHLNNKFWGGQNVLPTWVVIDDELFAGVRLHAGCSRQGVAHMQRHAHAPLGIETGGRVPVDFVGVDHASAAGCQSVGDAAILIAVSADGQQSAGVQDEYR